MKKFEILSLNDRTPITIEADVTRTENGILDFVDTHGIVIARFYPLPGSVVGVVE